MATCNKCGSKMRKRRAGVFECPRHGVGGIENGHALDRSGQPHSKAPAKQGPHLPYNMGSLQPTIVPAKGTQHV